MMMINDNGTVREMTAEEVAAMPVSEPEPTVDDAKAAALAAIQAATTIASLRNAMLNYIEVSGVN